jgi:hypothetical protein
MLTFVKEDDHTRCFLGDIESNLAPEPCQVPPLEMEYWPVDTGWTMYGLNEKQRLDEIRTVSRHVSSLLGIMVEDSLHDTVCDLCSISKACSSRGSIVMAID